MKDHQSDSSKAAADHFNAAVHTQQSANSRRNALRTLGKLGLGAAVLGAGSFLTAREARAQEAPSAADILNFALTLEYLEYFFYEQGVSSGVVGDDSNVFELIRDHENAHVEYLRGVITETTDADPVTYTSDDFDFNVIDGVAPFQDYGAFLTLAMGFEDTGVRAYKGQAANILGTDYLTPALQIHSLEARHAAKVRRIRAGMDIDVQPWIVGDSGTDSRALEAIYAGSDDDVFNDVDDLGEFPAEENTTQPIDLDVTTLGDYSDDEATAAFDEPLSMAAVLSIAGPFITGAPNDGDNGDDNDSD